MARARRYSVPLLFRLWNDKRLTRADIARELGVGIAYLTKLSAIHALPKRAVELNYDSIGDEPSPEELAGMEARKLECRERHMAARRAETYEATRSRSWKQRAG